MGRHAGAAVGVPEPAHGPRQGQGPGRGYSGAGCHLRCDAHHAGAAVAGGGAAGGVAAAADAVAEVQLQREASCPSHWPAAATHGPPPPCPQLVHLHHRCGHPHGRRRHRRHRRRCDAGVTRERCGRTPVRCDGGGCTAAASAWRGRGTAATRRRAGRRIGGPATHRSVSQHASLDGHAHTHTRPHTHTHGHTPSHTATRPHTHASRTGILGKLEPQTDERQALHRPSSNTRHRILDAGQQAFQEVLLQVRPGKQPTRRPAGVQKQLAPPPGGTAQHLPVPG